jgi:hypothetical protein
MNKTHVTIPIELLPELEAWGRTTAELFGKLRQNAGLPPKDVPVDQQWFWTMEWQALEREADEAVTTGEFVDFTDVDAAINYLHEQV